MKGVQLFAPQSSLQQGLLDRLRGAGAEPEIRGDSLCLAAEFVGHRPGARGASDEYYRPPKGGGLLRYSRSGVNGQRIRISWCTLESTTDGYERGLLSKTPAVA